MMPWCLASVLMSAITSLSMLLLTDSRHRSLRLASPLLLSVAGFRDVASAAQFDFPAMCTMLKRHLMVRSLWRNRRGLAMSSRHLSPSIFRRGLWSVATIKSSQPRVNQSPCYPQTFSFNLGRSDFLHL